jgi:hypothetical protein
MDPRRYIFVAAMTIALGLYSGLKCDKAEASTIFIIHANTMNAVERLSASEAYEQQDPWLSLMGAASEDDIHEALYSGRSLAEIAEANGADIETVIDYQVSELTDQLNERFAAGSISPEVYLAQLLEVKDIVTASAHTNQQQI